MVASGNEVGKISIRVVPDLDQFYEELNTALEAAEKKKATVKIDGDPDEFQRKIEEVTSKKRDTTVGVDAKTAGVTQKIESAAQDADAEVDVQLNQASLAKLRAQLAGIWRGLSGKAGSIEVPVELRIDKNRLQRELASALGTVGKFTAAVASSVAEIGSTVATGTGAAVKSSVGALGRINPASLARIGAIVVAVAALATPAVALLSGALAALPGLLTAVAAPMGVIALGLDGIKKAAEKAKPAFEGLKKAVSDTFEKGLTDSFVKIGEFIPKIQGQLTGLAGMMSSSFAGVINTLTTGAGLNTVRGIINDITSAVQRAAPGLQSFTNGLLNLTKGVTGTLLQGIADSFSSIGAEFDSWVSKVTSNGQLASAMDTLKGTLGEVLGLVKDIAAWGFENLADPKTGAQIRQFASDLRSIGNDILPQLKSGFEEVASIVNNIRGFLDACKTAAQAIADALPQTELDKNLQKNFKGLGLQAFSEEDALRMLVDPNFVPEAQKTGEAGGAALNEGFKNGLESTKGQIQAAIDSAGGAIQSGQFGGGISAEGIGPAVSSQVDTAISAATTRLQAFQGEFGGMIDTALQPLQTIGQKVSDAFSNAATTVSTSFAPIVTTIGLGATQIGAAITASLANLPLVFMTAFSGINSTVTGAFGSVVQTVATGASQINAAVAASLSNLPAVILSAMSGVAGVVAGGLAQAAGAAVTGAGQIVQGVLAGITPVLAVVQEIFAAIPGVIQGQMAVAVGAVQAAGAQMVSAALSFAGGMEQAGVAVGASFARGIASQSGTVAAAAAALMASARAFFPNSPADEGPFSGSGWVDKSGEAVGAGFAKGLSSSQQEVVATARALMQSVKDIFGSAEGLTLNFNMGPITQQAQQATTSVKQFGDALAAVPTPQLDTLTPSVAADPARKEELSRQLSLLEQERKSIEIAKARGEIDSAAAKARLAEIQDQKNILGLERDKLIYAEKYGDAAGGAASKADEAYKELQKKAGNMPVDFLKSIGKQAMQDIGMSGGGALGSFLDYGTKLGTSYVFNVSNVDEAMAVQRNAVNREGTGVVGR